MPSQNSRPGPRVNPGRGSSSEKPRFRGAGSATGGPEGDSLRAFIAIAINPDLLRKVGEVMDTYKQAMPHAVRWVDAGAGHLTLKFLGDTPTERIPQINAALQRAVAAIPAFEMRIEGRGCFPNYRRPRVIWLGVRTRGPYLEQLYQAIEREVAPLGFPTEEGGFTPHLTLGRVTREATREDEATIGRLIEESVVEVVGKQLVTEIRLMRSELRPAGAVHKQIYAVSLGTEQK
jgi:RNA 2',3'-cyclic 3'-phosphodiesterase